jgi:hypothetical protein
LAGTAADVVGVAATAVGTMRRLGFFASGAGVAVEAVSAARGSRVRAEPDAGTTGTGGSAGASMPNSAKTLRIIQACFFSYLGKHKAHAELVRRPDFLDAKRGILQLPLGSQTRTTRDGHLHSSFADFPDIASDKVRYNFLDTVAIPMNKSHKCWVGEVYLESIVPGRSSAGIVVLCTARSALGTS